MNRKRIWLAVLFMAAILLGGCSMRTIDEMYCLPKRSEGFLNLQSVIDDAMSGLNYHAPISGDRREPVQLVDLDGNGKAKGNKFCAYSDHRIAMSMATLAMAAEGESEIDDPAAVNISFPEFFEILKSLSK